MGERTGKQRVTDIDAIKRIALGQLEAGTVDGVSLSGIARELGLTSPAMYRYVASRDDLVSQLLADALEDLTAAMESGVARTRSPRAALAAAAGAYRAWALANPVRYQLCMSAPARGYQPPDEVVERGYRSLGVLVTAIARLLALQPTSAPVRSAAVRGWARLHGLVSLELAGHLGVLGSSPDALFDREIESFANELLRRSGDRPHSRGGN